MSAKLNHINSSGSPVQTGTNDPLPVTGTLTTNPAAPTSSNTTGAMSSVSFTRPTNTTAYTAGDVIGINAAGSAGSAIHTFALVGPAASSIIVTGADLTIDLTAIPSGMTTFRLHLYTSSPTAILDNAAYDLVTADQAKHVGFIDLGAPADIGSTLFVGVTNINQQITLAAASTSLFGILVTVGGYTPASGTTYQVRIRTLAV